VTDRIGPIPEAGSASNQPPFKIAQPHPITSPARSSAGSFGQSRFPEPLCQQQRHQGVCLKRVQPLPSGITRPPLVLLSLKPIIFGTQEQLHALPRRYLGLYSGSPASMHASRNFALSSGDRTQPGATWVERRQSGRRRRHSPIIFFASSSLPAPT
jgi:hypothetical protein